MFLFGKKKSEQPPAFTPPSSRDGALQIPERTYPVERLEYLKDHDRLAIHVWEDSKPPEKLPSSYGTLGETKDKGIPKALESSLVFRQSMSLFPKNGSMAPWEIKPDALPRLGYLIGLDQTRPHPARVISADMRNMFTNFGPQMKSGHGLSVDEKRHSKLNALYKDYDAPNQEKARLIAAGKHGRAFTEAQLDTMASIYADPTYAGLYKNAADEPDVTEHNEILVVAGREHIEGIVIPVYCSDETPVYRAKLQLAGAVTGLQHLDAGIDLPVIYYKVKDKSLATDAAQGHFELLGQGREQLIAKAYEAIHTLASFDDFHPLGLAATHALLELSQQDAYRDYVRTHFDSIDLAKPLAEQLRMPSSLITHAQPVAAMKYEAQHAR